MTFNHSPNHKKPRMFYLVPGEQMTAFMPAEEKEPLGPLAEPLGDPWSPHRNRSPATAPAGPVKARPAGFSATGLFIKTNRPFAS